MNVATRDEGLDSRLPRSIADRDGWWSAWGRSWRQAALVVAMAALTALLSVGPMPRGPVSGEQGVVVIAVSVAIGLATGVLMRSRWGLVLAPAAYVLAYEIGRRGIAGSSLDGIRLDSVYGIAAFLAGRGLHGLLALYPMIVGILIGRAVSRPIRLATLMPPAVLGLTVAGLTLLVATPGSTPPVVGPDGQPIPGSMAELTTVELQGGRQTISIRAADPDNPVLLYLSGGPGQSDIAFARALLEPLTEDFVVVVWDQRGSGTSYSALDPISTYTIHNIVADAIELTEYLRERFAEEKIYLLGESWGSTLGVLAVQERPQLFHAYIGSGQMVSQRETDRIIWRDLLAYAQGAGDWDLYDRILELGEPPYRDMPWSNVLVMGYYGLLETPYAPPAAYLERGEASGVSSFGLLGQEYGFVENANLVRGLVDMFSLLYPQLQEVDFRRDVAKLDVPVYLLDGTHELRGRRDLALEWFEQLDAPHKALITYQDAGHAVAFERVDDLLRLMNEEILPRTYTAQPAVPSG
jgi:pimeloyl-ACP methyl ester carboxylesterase